MKRSSFVLGFALAVTTASLVVAVHLSRDPGGESRSAVREAPATAPRHRSDSIPENPRPVPDEVRPGTPSEALRVVLPESWLASLPPPARAAWLARATAVEKAALDRLAVLTKQLGLSEVQRVRMFPLLVRGTPGFDPVMLSGDPGTADLTSDEAAAARRQLWWQDTLTRLETGLTEDAARARSPQPAGSPPAAK